MEPTRKPQFATSLDDNENDNNSNNEEENINTSNSVAADPSSTTSSALFGGKNFQGSSPRSDNKLATFDSSSVSFPGQQQRRSTTTSSPLPLHTTTRHRRRSFAAPTFCSSSGRNLNENDDDDENENDNSAGDGGGLEQSINNPTPIAPTVHHVGSLRYRLMTERYAEETVVLSRDIMSARMYDDILEESGSDFDEVHLDQMARRDLLTIMSKREKRIREMHRASMWAVMIKHAFLQRLITSKKRRFGAMIRLKRWIRNIIFIRRARRCPGLRVAVCQVDARPTPKRILELFPWLKMFDLLLDEKEFEERSKEISSANMMQSFLMGDNDNNDNNKNENNKNDNNFLLSQRTNEKIQVEIQQEHDRLKKRTQSSSTSARLLNSSPVPPRISRTGRNNDNSSEKELILNSIRLVGKREMVPVKINDDDNDDEASNSVNSNSQKKKNKGEEDVFDENMDNININSNNNNNEQSNDYDDNSAGSGGSPITSGSFCSSTNNSPYSSTSANSYGNDNITTNNKTTATTTSTKKTPLNPEDNDDPTIRFERKKISQILAEGLAEKMLYVTGNHMTNLAERDKPVSMWFMLQEGRMAEMESATLEIQDDSEADSLAKQIHHRGSCFGWLLPLPFPSNQGQLLLLGTTTKLWRISHDDFREVLEETFDMRDRDTEIGVKAVVDRATYEGVVEKLNRDYPVTPETLRKVPVLSKVSDFALNWFCDNCDTEPLALHRGTQLSLPNNANNDVFLPCGFGSTIVRRRVYSKNATPTSTTATAGGDNNDNNNTVNKSSHHHHHHNSSLVTVRLGNTGIKSSFKVPETVEYSISYNAEERGLIGADELVLPHISDVAVFVETYKESSSWWFPVWRFDKQSFQRLIFHDPVEFVKQRKFVTERILRRMPSVSENLCKIKMPMFRYIDGAAITTNVFPYLERRMLFEGDRITSSPTHVDGVYLIVHGVVRRRRYGGSKQAEIQQQYATMKKKQFQQQLLSQLPTTNNQTNQHNQQQQQNLNASISSITATTKQQSPSNNPKNKTNSSSLENNSPQKTSSLNSRYVELLGGELFDPIDGSTIYEVEMTDPSTWICLGGSWEAAMEYLPSPPLRKGMHELAVNEKWCANWDSRWTAMSGNSINGDNSINNDTMLLSLSSSSASCCAGATTTAAAAGAGGGRRTQNFSSSVCVYFLSTENLKYSFKEMILEKRRKTVEFCVNSRNVASKEHPSVISRTVIPGFEAPVVTASASILQQQQQQQRPVSGKQSSRERSSSQRIVASASASPIARAPSSLATNILQQQQSQQQLLGNNMLSGIDIINEPSSPSLQTPPVSLPQQQQQQPSIQNINVKNISNQPQQRQQSFLLGWGSQALATPTTDNNIVDGNINMNMIQQQQVDGMLLFPLQQQQQQQQQQIKPPSPLPPDTKTISKTAKRTLKKLDRWKIAASTDEPEQNVFIADPDAHLFGEHGKRRRSMKRKSTITTTTTSTIPLGATRTRKSSSATGGDVVILPPTLLHPRYKKAPVVHELLTFLKVEPRPPNTAYSDSDSDYEENIERDFNPKSYFQNRKKQEHLPTSSMEDIRHGKNSHDPDAVIISDKQKCVGLQLESLLQVQEERQNSSSSMKKIIQEEKNKAKNIISSSSAAQQAKEMSQLLLPHEKLIRKRIDTMVVSVVDGDVCATDQRQLPYATPRYHHHHHTSTSASSSNCNSGASSKNATPTTSNLNHFVPVPPPPTTAPPSVYSLSHRRAQEVKQFSVSARQQQSLVKEDLFFSYQQQEADSEKANTSRKDVKGFRFQGENIGVLAETSLPQKAAKATSKSIIERENQLRYCRPIVTELASHHDFAQFEHCLKNLKKKKNKDKNKNK